MHKQKVSILVGTNGAAGFDRLEHSRMARTMPGHAAYRTASTSRSARTSDLPAGNLQSIQIIFFPTVIASAHT